MRESLWSKIRRFLLPRPGFMFPRRVNTAVAVWWEWGGKTWAHRRHVPGQENP